MSHTYMSASCQMHMNKASPAQISVCDVGLMLLRTGLQLRVWIDCCVLHGCSLLCLTWMYNDFRITHAQTQEIQCANFCGCLRCSMHTFVLYSYICLHICMYQYICMYTHVHLCAYNMYAYICHIYMYPYIWLHIYMYQCICINAYVSMHMYIHARILQVHVCRYTHTRISTYIYVYTYRYIDCNICKYMYACIVSKHSRTHTH